MRLAALLLLCASCASFEDPTIVIDLRVLGIETTPPEQVLDIDPMKPPTFDELLAQLQPIRVRALIVEPGSNGDLSWAMTACVLDERSSRCDEDSLAFEFAQGTLRDPEHFSIGNPCPDEPVAPAGTVCGDLIPDNRVVQMLAKSLDDDPARGLGGVDLGISLHVRGAGEAFAAKRVRFAPRIPLDRRPNNNPHIDQLLLGQAGVGIAIDQMHCNDVGFGSVNVVDAGDTVTIFPVARDGDREDFVVPTLDGQSEHFTEYLTYQWIATGGDFTDDFTGGPPDVFGNIKLDGSEWKVPEVNEATLVTVWVIQRDSRYGVRWREGCIKVLP